MRWEGMGRERFVQPKLDKLVRRGPREYVMVGKQPDGRQVEIRLGPARFELGGPRP